MSLQIWLPLTKDLRQQGLSNVTVTNNGAIFNSAGKLGGCYAPNGLTLTNLGDLKVYPMTIAFWCKTTNTGTPSWEQIVLIDNTSNSQIHGVYVADASRLKYEYNPSVNAYSVNPKEWHHYTFIINNGDSKVYVDGVLNSSSSETVTADIIGRLRIGTTNTIQLNDFRIYDHCLSPMEVKEIAKGLVLHYPLNRGGWGQENLITGYDTSFLSYPDGAVTLFSNQMNGGAQEIVSNIGGATKCLHLHSNGGNGRQYGTLSATSGKSYIISCDYYSTSSQATPFRGELNGGNYSWAGSNAAAYTTPNKWVRLSFSYLNLTSYATIFYFMQCSQNTDCYIKNLKIEEGSITTPWSPNSSSILGQSMGLNSTTEYDCSGFCNNGTRTGTFTWTSDTPKYSVSQYFNGSSYILTDSGTFSWFSFDKCTLAAWFKPTATPSQYTGTIGISHDQNAGHKSFCIGNYGGYFTVCTADGNYINTTSSILPNNEWHHCVATLDGTTVKMYIDGVLVKTYTLSWGSTALTSDTRFQVGVDLPGSDEMYTGYYSDVRAYATALSADDVKSLYQNSAYIDSSGNVYGAVHSEV